MNKEELKDLIRQSTKSKKSSLSLYDLGQLQSVAKVNLMFDREENDYYYQIDLKDLVDKEFKKELITDNGWMLSEDGDFIILYIN